MSYPNKQQLGRLAVGLVLFAALMALQADVQGMWLRALVAGSAFGVLAWSVFAAARK